MITREDLKLTLWEACYTTLLAIVLGNYWVGFHLGVLSPLPFKGSVTYLVAALCGALIYFFTKSVRRTVFASAYMCAAACIIVALVIYMPAYRGIVDAEVSVYLALRVSALTFFYTFPIAVTGCAVTAYLYPD